MAFDSINQIITVNPRSPADVNLYNLYLRVLEIDAPTYFSEYLIKVRVDNSGDTFIVNNPKNKLTGILINDEIKESKVSIAWSRPIIVPPQELDILKS
jgi:hypothetical protein